ncbi:hypothetical protein [Candidatus Pelagibacter bacterium nBUS_28]|uniref:hypothetical protein n=1 Tax=Candidatus Pelagibacter bacterium nBUS_28 TaxID=3374189 RepID=UPI003EBF0ADC
MSKIFKNLLTSLFLPNYYYFLAILRSIKILFKNNLSDYNGLYPLHALNTFFYKVQNLNIKKFSRKGISSIIGGGNYNLSNWWHLPNFSHFFFTRAPAISVLWGSLMILSWLIFIDISVNGKIEYSVLPLLSTIFYIYVVSLPNYNIFGLIVVSPILYYLINNDTFFFVSFSILLPIISPTVFIIFSPIVFLYSILTANHLYFFLYCLLIPLIFINLLYCKKKDLWLIFSWMLNAMGVRATKFKLYRDNLTFKKLNLRDCYYIFSYSLAIFCLSTVESSYTYFCVYIFVIHIINRKLIKFSDEQNILAVYVISFVTLLIISKDFNIFSFGLAIIALFEPIKNIQKINPINTRNLIKQLNDFIGKNKKPLLLCFSNPKNNYRKVFDGQRILVEPISYVCNKNNRLLLPDWWAVFNKSSLENFWIDNKHDLMLVMKNYNVDEIISTSKETDLFFDDSFSQKGIFDWDKVYFQEFRRDLKIDLGLKDPIIWKKYKKNN